MHLEKIREIGKIEERITILNKLIDDSKIEYGAEELSKKTMG